jgi:hypothetical protein
MLDRARRDNNKLILDLEKRHRDERAELADRIQRPDILPIRPARTEPKRAAGGEGREGVRPGRDRRPDPRRRQRA